MLFYNNGRFSLGSVSFKLPNEIMIDTQSDEISGQGFYLTAPDNGFGIEIDCRHSKYDAYGEIAHVFDGQLSYTLNSEIKPIIFGGISGFCAFYEDRKFLYEEYAFDLNGCENGNIFDIYVRICKDCSAYDNEYKKRVVTELLDSIKQ